MDTIKIAILGVGNCASSLVQGAAYYAQDDVDSVGLIDSGPIQWNGSYEFDFVCAFDIDQRKVGKPLTEAIFAAPNCTKAFFTDFKSPGPIVQMGQIHDGFAAHFENHPADRRPLPSTDKSVDVVQALRDSGAEVLVCYLPVGSEKAARFYAECCLEAGVAMINCIPVFIASDRVWAQKFKDAGIPIIGDDIKSQIGATIVHRALAKLFTERGVKVERSYQLNTGGNTDFLNMKDQERLTNKRISKTEAVVSQVHSNAEHDNFHIGPSDYVSWQKDNKVAFIRLEGTGFGGVPLNLEMRLSVEDSPNSAAVVFDAIICAKLALTKGMSGPVHAACSYYMKHPPEQLSNDDAAQRITAFFEDKS